MVKSRLIRLLSRGGKGEQFVNNSVLITSRILQEESSLAHKLRPGNTYGHTIELGRNLALWPLEFLLESSVKDTQQISYVGTHRPREWVFRTQLDPFHGDKQTAILACNGKRSGEDEIVTHVSSNSGHRDTLTVPVEIE